MTNILVRTDMLPPVNHEAFSAELYISYNKNVGQSPLILPLTLPQRRISEPCGFKRIGTNPQSDFFAVQCRVVLTIRQYAAELPHATLSR